MQSYTQERDNQSGVCGGMSRERSDGTKKMEKKIIVIGNYHNHDASRIVHKGGVAPTVKENHGTVTATVRKMDKWKIKRALNTMPDGTCRTLKSQYHKNSAANFVREGTFGATGVLRARNAEKDNSNRSDG